MCTSVQRARTAAEADPFAHFHRRDRRRAVLRVLGTCAGAAVVLGLASGWVGSVFGAQTTVVAHAQDTLPLPLSQESVAIGGATAGIAGGGTTEPAPVKPVLTGPGPISDTPLSTGNESTQSPGVSAPLTSGAETPAPGVQDWNEYDITISAVGAQAEVDQCVWVRMDLDAAAPIVGAHNSCGGDLVLNLEVGDVVTLRGYGLDSRYLVTGSRDARPGDNAAAATAGMVAAVILQTCYWHNDQVRLVSMLQIDESLSS